MPLKRKLKRDISVLKNQQKLTTNYSCTNELMSCGPDTVAPPAVSPDLWIDNGANIEEWMPNLPFDSNKPMWNDVVMLRFGSVQFTEDFCEP